MAETHYILGQVIARGGMAEVYRGLQIGQDGFRRLVAVKRILPQHSSNHEFAEMFRDEAHIGQRLQHANIVKVECYDVIEGSPSIVMEFVDGTDVRAVLAEIEKSKTIKRIPVSMAIYIIAEAARGLHYAHQRRDDISGRPLDIVHRDISPQNILVSFNGEVKVTDFGIAAADQDFKTTETRAGIVKGKYSYMSPEQISAKKVDARSDVFALGIVLWEILAMRRLFAADNDVEVIEMVKTCRIPYKLTQLNPEVSEELEAIVMRSLAREPQRRFASMDELERALRNYLSKVYPNFTVGDLSNLFKQTLATKHDASQEEIKKMLTATNLRVSKGHQGAIEFELGEAERSSKSNLNVARRSNIGQENSLIRNQSGIQTKSQIQSLSRSSNAYLSQRASSKRRRSSSNSSLAPIAFAVAIAIVAGMFFFKVQMNAAKDGGSVALRTTPSIVRIKINGKNIQNGRYVRTPTQLRLDQGPNLIEISRPGYNTETLSVDTARNEQRFAQISKLKPRALFANLRIVLTGTATIQFLLNEGFASGTLTPQQPVMEVKDLSENQPSNLLIIEKNKKPFRCTFTPVRSTARRPFILMVDPARNTCEIRSPKDRGEP